MALKHYNRVLPRDAFNEGNLLKCLGGLFLFVEEVPAVATFVHEYCDRPFCISQDDSNGAITCVNVFMYLGGEKYLFWRPLNSRKSWPLYIIANDDVMNVFKNDECVLSDEFKAFIGFGKETAHE